MSLAGGRGQATASFGVLRPTQRIAVALANPVLERLGEYIQANRRLVPTPIMVGPEQFRGQFVALCGAGPSLREADLRGVDQVIACNSAVQWLVEQGLTIHGAVGIDQTARLAEEWANPPDVPYYLATSVDPTVVRHLQNHQRALFFFHNAVGIPDEQALYRTWPRGFMVGRGATVVSRFAWVLLWAGAERVDIYGADCALGDGDIAHANGEHVTEAYQTPLLLEGRHPPRDRTWRTRPDLLMEAVDLVRLVRASQGRVRLLGDTLPVSLLGKDDAYLDQVNRRMTPAELQGASDGQ